MYALYPSWEPNSCSYSDFDAWCFDVSDASIAMKVLFANWDAGTVYAKPAAKKFITQTLLGINAQVIEGKLPVPLVYFDF